MRLLLLVIGLMSFSLHASVDYRKPQSPSELHALFGEYFIQKDLTGLTSLFDENAVLVLDASGKQAIGRKEIGQALKGYMSGDVEMVTKSVSIHVNGTLAQVRSEWEIPNVTSGVALEVMHYVDGGWLYIIDNPNGF
ncbi:nuclear transport factor 2 family protein [Vibrio vulnificus]|nr:nuclear transport factor 2 family protein [Vibrio vulnificus]EIC2760203.1 nuclear transport factor 2 family protein [Vibrio vulnificus]